MSEQMQEEYGENGIRQSAAELFKRWKRAVEHGESNLQIGMAWMDEATRLAKRNALLVAEIETVRAERDEARRHACEVEADRYLLLHKVNGLGEAPYTPYESKDVALRMGWDCFKEKP